METLNYEPRRALILFVFQPESVKITVERLRVVGVKMLREVRDVAF